MYQLTKKELQETVSKLLYKDFSDKKIPYISPKEKEAYNDGVIDLANKLINKLKLK